ncbi:ParB/RepB/Spo0J family partition protein [Tundrisphaera lichenicola]|uniref:ParB/RepB/Spo0J family partition protein n=1 Tax=Tundrisphaera lichenicola TaxID=2029860 RepID=UPI003EBC3FB6
MPRMETRPVSWLKPDANQPRKTFDEAELRLLGESLRKRQLQPVLARSDGTIIAGERRYRAALLVGLKELLVIATEESLSEAEIRAIQLTENIHRADLTGYEKWLACRELLELNPGWQGKDLAAHLHLDPSTVTRLLSPSKCVREWQEALREGKVGISDCYAAAKLPPEDQPGLLALKLGGASRDALETTGRKKRSAGAPVVRASKIKCPLVGGAVVTVAGDEISLDDAMEALKEAVKAFAKARDTGLDAKTAQAVWRDVAKAG